MESIIHADIFFFISTIALVLVTIGVIIVIVYAVRILNDVKHVSEKVREESDLIIEDIGELRQGLKTSKWKWVPFIHFFKSLFRRRAQSHHHKK